MAEAALSLRPLYQLQLRTCAAIAELALRHTADLIDANVDAARRAIARNLEQCETLMTGNGTAGAPTFVAVDRVSSADTASRWQRKWLDTAARTQVEMIHLLDQLVADWAALAGGPVASQPRSQQPVAMVIRSISELFDWTLQAWTGVFGAGPMAAAASSRPIARRNAHGRAMTA
jgi:phenylacetate-coenzyme A ligase PaaK-like adenylate-forming protein